jgi:hypothetical protein
VFVNFHCFYAFLKCNLIDIMLNTLRMKRVTVTPMPNLLLREINSLRSKYHAFRLTNNEHLNLVCSIVQVVCFKEDD